MREFDISKAGVVRNEHDEDGIWSLFQDSQTGERHYMLIVTAGDLHNEGWLFLRGRWVRRPSMGGDLEAFRSQIGG